METKLTPELRDAMREALVESIAEDDTFARGSAMYLVTLNQTPDGTVLEGHELADVLDLWPSLSPGWDE